MGGGGPVQKKSAFGNWGVGWCNFFPGFGNYFQHAHHVSNDYNDNITLPLNFAYAYGMSLLKKGNPSKKLLHNGLLSM